MDKERKTEFIFLCFFAYSVLGWCYEVFLEVVVYRWEFSNRGFLLGPYCPVYGFGALLLIGLLRRFQYKKMVFCKVNLTPIFIFLMIMGITTAVELGTSYLLEAIVGKWLWDYTSYFINLVIVKNFGPGVLGASRRKEKQRNYELPGMVSAYKMGAHKYRSKFLYYHHKF